jgi:hypothetical protein
MAAAGGAGAGTGVGAAALVTTGAFVVTLVVGAATRYAMVGAAGGAAEVGATTAGTDVAAVVEVDVTVSLVVAVVVLYKLVEDQELGETLGESVTLAGRGGAVLLYAARTTARNRTDRVRAARRDLRFPLNSMGRERGKTRACKLGST